LRWAVKKMRGKVKQMATATDRVDNVLKDRDAELFESLVEGAPAFKEA
jgi:hypothetical protein